LTPNWKNAAIGYKVYKRYVWHVLAFSATSFHPGRYSLRSVKTLMYVNAARRHHRVFVLHFNEQQSHNMRPHTLLLASVIGLANTQSIDPSSVPIGTRGTYSSTNLPKDRTD
jgi:hypothetical protein